MSEISACKTSLDVVGYIDTFTASTARYVVPHPVATVHNTMTCPRLQPALSLAARTCMSLFGCIITTCRYDPISTVYAKDPAFKYLLAGPVDFEQTMVLNTE